jgi:hypothetical protein
MSKQVVPAGKPLHVSAAGSRLGTHRRLRGVVIRFGDRTRPVHLRSLHRAARHRYARRGRYLVRVTVTDNRGGSKSASRRIVVTNRPGIKALRETVVVRGGRVISAETPLDPAASVLVLRPGTRSPGVGGALVVLPGGILPQGFLGTVDGASRNIDGTTTVTARPAPLDAAYSRFSVAFAGKLGMHDVSLAPGADAPTRALPRPAKLSSLPFTCTTKSGHKESVAADFSNTHVDASLDIRSRAIHFLFTTHPVLTLNLHFEGSASCTLANKQALQITVPVAAPLTLTIKPEFKLDASGSIDATTTWSPRLAIGFDRAPGISDNPIGFGSSITFNATGNADANLYAGLSVELGVGGRIGVTGSAGPDLHATARATTNGSTSTACAHVEAFVKADLTANADVFIKSWSWSLFHGEFARTTLYEHCATTGGGGVSGGGGGAATGGGGAPAGGGGTPSGGGSTPSPGGGGPPSGGGGSTPSGASVTLGQGPAAPAGYRYAVTLDGFGAGQAVSVSCYDSVSPSGFYTFTLTADGSGHASTASYCYSGDGPDHWVVAGGIESNHVTWGGSSPPPQQPPPTPTTWAETTGGVAHTWTNYTNAGGNQGPSIPSNATVQIACKITGFRVADGNTWWYRIASSPWNNAYYVSADAFYNNGQTSGSLHGTPFVDPAVGNC